MQQPAPAPIALPDYASWPDIEAVAAQMGVVTRLVNRWIVWGLKTEAGRLRLKAVKVGGRWKVNPAWVVEFVTATTLAAVPKSAIAGTVTETQPTKPSARAEQAEVDACMERLRNRGIGDTPRRRERGPRA